LKDEQKAGRDMLDSVLMAFSLYSRIPVPQAKWNEKSMRWCICFLPLVGAVIGLIQWAAYMLLGYFPSGQFSAERS
jgi:adenosylcobinamide-GDP ribazoletransferase